ncbi:MAG: septum formation family protein [Segniliparus sp.]|uniref:septum formation family protein n=1 Tax=Segniliparus sp. TaxID=2804064 RepID=UPI003F2FAA2C
MALRAVLAGVGLGAVALAALTVSTDRPLIPDLVQDKQAEAQRAEAPGACFASGPSGRPGSVVDCAAEHVFELAAALDLGEYPGSAFSSAAYPDQKQIAAWSQQLCEGTVNTYLRGRLDAHGRFRIGALLSSEKAWSSGEHVLRCGLEVPGGSRKLLPSTGRVADQDQSLTYDTGVCVGAEHNMPTDPVDCGQPHAFEVIGQADLAAQFPDRTDAAPPSEDEQNNELKGLCEKAAETYLGDAERLRATTLDVNWTIVKPQSWLVGSRKAVCFLAKHNDQGFAIISGSVKGDVLVDGAKPVAPPKPTRSTAQPIAPPGRPPE